MRNMSGAIACIGVAFHGRALIHFDSFAVQMSLTIFRTSYWTSRGIRDLQPMKRIPKPKQNR